MIDIAVLIGNRSRHEVETELRHKLAAIAERHGDLITLPPGNVPLITVA